MHRARFCGCSDCRLGLSWPERAEFCVSAEVAWELGASYCVPCKCALALAGLFRKESQYTVRYLSTVFEKQASRPLHGQDAVLCFLYTLQGFWVSPRTTAIQGGGAKPLRNTRACVRACEVRVLLQL